MQWLGEWSKVIDVASKILIAIIGTWWAVTNTRLQISSSEAALRATLDHQRAAVRSQREIEEAKLALSVASLLKCKLEIQQIMALQIVQATAPGHASQLANVLKTCEQSTKDRNLLDKFTVDSMRSENAERFLQYLDDARQSMRFDLVGQAVEEFERAYNALPRQTYPAKIDEDSVQQAKRARDEGRLKEAADHYQNAFRRIQTTEGVNALPYGTRR